MKTLWHENGGQEISQRLEQLRPDLQRQWGRMTAHQMVCHLSDSFLSVTGEISNPPVDNLFSRTVMKWLALYLPVPWPKGIKTRPAVDQEIDGTRPVEFAADVERLKAVIDRFSNRTRDFEFKPHPLFGRMSEKEWMRWGYLHCDHHFRQFGI